MIDPYRITDDPGTRRATPVHTGADVILRGVLWLVLVLSLVGNTVASAAGASTAVHIGLGGTTAAAAAVLALTHLRRR